MTEAPLGAPRLSWRRFVLALGPGVVVMLADTDAGSVVTAAQSGLEWGYRLLPLQFAMIPLLYAVQELTIRLAFATDRGLAELVRLRFGRAAAALTLATVAASCLGALVTQLSALGGLAQALGIPAPPLILATLAFFVWVASFGAFETAERVGMALGLFELAFFVVAWRAGPQAGEIAAQAFDAPLGDTRFLYLTAANIGTTFLPWAAFYQQSAMLGKGLTSEYLWAARLETLGGAILCQIVTVAILVAGAATAGRGLGGVADVAALSRAFTQTLGPATGRIVFALGLTGSATVAAMVSGLTIGWVFSETFCFPRRRRGPLLAAFIATLLAAGAFVLAGADVVKISLGAGALNAILLPIVLTLLFALARSELKGALSLSPAYAAALAVLFAALSAISLYTGLRGWLG